MRDKALIFGSIWTVVVALLSFFLTKFTGSRIFWLIGSLVILFGLFYIIDLDWRTV